MPTNTPQPAPSPFIAYNKLTNGFFVKGKGFTGQCAGAASPLNAQEVAVLRATYLNVEVSRER